MEAGDDAGQGVDLPGAELARCRQPVIERRLREAAHLHRVFERPRCFGGAKDRRRFRAENGHHLQIELRRQPPVQAQLFFAVEAPRRQRREVEEAEIHRLLDLVGVIARQQDVGDVGLDLLDTCNRMRIARRIAKRCDQRRLIDSLLGHRRAQSSPRFLRRLMPLEAYSWRSSDICASSVATR
ncbi:hypothetical protein GALL_220370 [mine drainage metagenome]|uniref:Uncharacterized protein n=1 Tax=mine drainage metagenome TaxID=410659 RepID=A0A1J5RIG7_9ZZZZ